MRSATKTVDDNAIKGYVNTLVNRIDGLGGGVVASVTTFYRTSDPTLVSKDRHATLIPVDMAGDQNQATRNADRLHNLVVASAGGGSSLAQTGEASLTELSRPLPTRTSNGARSSASRRP